MSNPKIVEVNHGVANNFGKYIEINKNLKKYPNLLNPIMKHELAHTKEFFSVHDLKLDFVEETGINNFEMLKFMFKYPRSFTQLLPFYWTRKKGFVYDINLMIMYLISISVFISILYIGGKYS